MNKKAYLIKGSTIENGERKSWIERVTISKIKAEEIKKILNNSLIEEIEKGKDVFDKYIKKDQDEIPWEEKVFNTEKMSEEEFKYFSYYRYGTKLPFIVHEMDLN
jgi:hypothetical protein